MKLSKRTQTFFIFYTFVALILLGMISMDVFREINIIIHQIIFSALSLNRPVEVLPMTHIFIISILISLLPSLYFLSAGISRAATLAVTSFASIIVAVIGILLWKNILLPISYFEAALVIGIAVGVILNMIFVSSEAEFLRLAFSQFVSESVLRELLQDPDKLKIQGKDAVITVMFMDIRGFTAYSEKNPPILVINQLNNLLDKVTNAILNHNGTVDKYMGDAVMAMWGAPAPDKKQATNACAAALEIRKVILEETQFKVGIGINTGHAIIGNMGSSRRFDYTAIGDTVNTAFRLEKATKKLHETILITESVRAELHEEESINFKTRDLGKINVRGKSRNVRVYGLLNNSAAD